MDGISSGTDSVFNHLNQLNHLLLESMERVGTGQRINHASDDPSGYYSSKVLERQVRISDVLARNLERERNSEETQSSRIDSLMGLAEEISGLIQAAKGSEISPVEKDSLQIQITQLSKELDQVLKNSGMGQALDFSLDPQNLVVNGNPNQLQNAQKNLHQGFLSLGVLNSQTGSSLNQISRQLSNLENQAINIQSTLSTQKDSE